MITEFKGKKSLIQEIGMKFDEAVVLFSKETLLSMSMVSIVGGSGTNTYCDGAQCVTGCNNNCGCGTSSTGSGGTNTGGSGSNGGTNSTSYYYSHGGDGSIG